MIDTESTAKDQNRCSTLFLPTTLVSDITVQTPRTVGAPREVSRKVIRLLDPFIRDPDSYKTQTAAGFDGTKIYFIV